MHKRRVWHREIKEKSIVSTQSIKRTPTFMIRLCMTSSSLELACSEIVVAMVHRLPELAGTGERVLHEVDLEIKAKHLLVVNGVPIDGHLELCC